MFIFSKYINLWHEMSRKHICLRIPVLIGLGAMGLLVFGLLPGCGSDSTPAGVVKTGPGEKALVKKALVKKQPDSKHIEVFPGVTLEEVEATMAASRTNPPREVFPGVTLEEVEAKMAASRTNQPKEVFPGLTQGKRN